MVEFFKHLFGCCGESHPTLFYLLGIAPLLIMVRCKLNTFFKSIKIILGTFLKRHN